MAGLRFTRSRSFLRQSQFPALALPAAILGVVQCPLPAQIPNDLAPQFTARAEGDPNGDHWLKFPTVPGWHYVVEKSTDLATFTVDPAGYFYGDGTDKQLFLYHAEPSGAPAESKPFRALYFHVHCYLTGPEGSYAPRVRVEKSGSWSQLLSSPFPRKNDLSFVTWEDADFRYHLMVTTHVHAAGEGDVVEPDASLSAADAADWLLFQDHLSAITGAVTRPTGVPTAPDPENPPPPVAAQHFFYRVTAAGIDTNGNGLMDWWELGNGFNAFAILGAAGWADPFADADADGLQRWQEQLGGTRDSSWDSDEDGYSDADELNDGDARTRGNDANSHPADDGDSDGDGLKNLDEVEHGTSILNPDSDGDTVTDLNDAVGYAAAFTHAPEPEYSFLPITIGSGIPISVSSAGHVLLKRGTQHILWTPGQGETVLTSGLASVEFHKVNNLGWVHASGFDNSSDPPQWVSFFLTPPTRRYLTHVPSHDPPFFDWRPHAIIAECFSDDLSGGPVVCGYQAATAYETIGGQMQSVGWDLIEGIKWTAANGGPFSGSKDFPGPGTSHISVTDQIIADPAHANYTGMSPRGNALLNITRYEYPDPFTSGRMYQDGLRTKSYGPGGLTYQWFQLSDWNDLAPDAYYYRAWAANDRIAENPPNQAGAAFISGPCIVGSRTKSPSSTSNEEQLCWVRTLRPNANTNGAEFVTD